MMPSPGKVLPPLYGLVILLAAAQGVDGARLRERTPTVPRVAVERVDAVPMSFEATGGPGLFLARGDGYFVRLAPDQVWLALAPAAPGGGREWGPTSRRLVRLRLPGARADAAAIAESPLPGSVNYLIGGDPADWRSGVSLHARVRYRDVWPGIDVVYHGRGGRLEHDFVVAAGADTGAARFAFDGVPSARLDDGAIVLDVGGGKLRLDPPVVYQERGDGREAVAGRFEKRADGAWGFVVGAHDAGRPLVIDPVLTFASFLGGDDQTDQAHSIAVGPGGDIYLTGMTFSADFPTTAGSWDEMCSEAGVPCSGAGGSEGDAFVTRVSADATTLVYSTFLGGRSGDQGHGIAVDAAGRAYIGGHTDSSDFPTTPGAPDTLFEQQEGFVTVLSADGAALEWSTYLGGASTEQVRAIALRGPLQTPCVTGLTRSTNFSTTAGAFDTTHGGSNDVFVTCYDASGAVVYSTLLGGTSGEEGHGLAGGPSGEVYVSGVTGSTGYPTTAGAYDTALGGTTDFFVTKIAASGAALVFSTFLGGTGGDFIGADIAVDATGAVYFTGETSSTTFPTTPGAYDTSLSAVPGGVMVKLNATGSALVYSTFLEKAQPWAVAVDAGGRASITGIGRAGMPTTADAFDASISGTEDLFLTTFTADGSGLVYATFLGEASPPGLDAEEGRDIATDPDGNVYLCGLSNAADFPVTPGVFDPTLNDDFEGGWNAVFARFTYAAGDADLALAITDAPDPVSPLGTLLYTLDVANGGPDEATSVTVLATLPQGVTYLGATGPGWGCRESAGVVTCVRSLLAAATTAPDIVLSVDVGAATSTLQATATVSTLERDPDPSNNAAAAETAIDLPPCADQDGDAYVLCAGCSPPGGTACGDCDDFDGNRDPGAAEACDVVDNDCDGQTDEGFAPVGHVALAWLDGLLSWGSIAAADAYDLVRGDLTTLRLSGFGSSEVCLADDQAGMTFDDPAQPPVGEGSFYLVRAVRTDFGACNAAGTYDSGGAGQLAPRDPALAGSPCP